MTNHKAVEEACRAIRAGALADAKKIIKQEYPFRPLQNERRNYGAYQKTKVFLSDGFVDRYSGEKLIFPPVLRIISFVIPDEFPFHKNWKMSECHLAYWQLLPTVDHIIPVSRGGCDGESNWVCTSQFRNSAKANWLIEELGWQLHKPGNLKDRDGLLGWFIEYAISNPKVLDDGYIRSWHQAAGKAAALEPTGQPSGWPAGRPPRTGEQTDGVGATTPDQNRE